MPFLFSRTFVTRLARLLCIAAISLALAGCDGLASYGNPAASGSGVQDGAASGAPPSAVSIRAAQRHLAALGYDPGRADGVLGKKTKNAIKHFQVDAELAVDGELTPRIEVFLEKAYSQQRAGNTATGQQGNAAGGAVALKSAIPSYETGDVYVYSDGRVETVSRVGPERTVWEATDDGVYTAYRNFILPPVSWKSGASNGENQIEPDADRKWPPATAKGVVFQVESTVGGEVVDAPEVWKGRWRCTAGGVTRVEVAVGRFDAVVIQCTRSKPAPGTWKKRTWYYVAEIGHYVRRIDRIYGTGRKVTVDLVAVRPGGSGWPPAARGGLDWAVQSALDSNSAQKTVEWRSSAVGATFNIRVKDNVAVSGKAKCRRYGVERVSPDQIRIFPAIACKRPEQERWLTPGLDPGAVSPRSLKLP